LPHRKRPDRIRNPDAILKAVRPCRQTMTRAVRKVKPFCFHYRGMQMIVVFVATNQTLIEP
jgi:hypothetical protein